VKGSGFGCEGVRGGGGVGWMRRNAAPGARRTKTITEGKGRAVAMGGGWVGVKRARL